MLLWILYEMQCCDTGNQWKVLRLPVMEPVIFIWAAVARSLGNSSSGVRQSPDGGQSPSEAETVCRHCLRSFWPQKRSKFELRLTPWFFISLFNDGAKRHFAGGEERLSPMPGRLQCRLHRSHNKWGSVRNVDQKELHLVESSLTNWSTSVTWVWRVARHGVGTDAGKE